ncbi:MAG: HEAT repeat domain-containing protein, partial [Planctomycetota bacterium]
ARRALIDALADPHWGLRWRATRILARLDAAPEIDACLVRMLKDPDVSVRSAALRGLIARGWLDRAAAEERDAPAADADGEVALTYLRAMTEHRIDAATEASRLLKALGDPHAEVRAYAFQALYRLRETERIPRERLRAGIEDADCGVRIAAILAWERDPQAEGLDVLLKALADEEVFVREEAARRLRLELEFRFLYSPGRVTGRPGFVEAMIRALGDESPIVRGEAAWMVGTAGNAAEAAVPALVRMLDDPVCRRPAAESLGSIGVADPDAIRKLDATLASADIDDRFEAARALWRLGRVPEGLLAVFVEMLRNGENRRRGEAAQVLGELGEAARPIVGELIAALANEDFGVREDVINALGNLGSIAKEATPELEKLRDQDPDALVGWAAEKAIEKIRAAAAREGR